MAIAGLMSMPMKKTVLSLSILCLVMAMAQAEPGHKFPPIKPDELAKIAAALPQAKVQPLHPRRLLVFYRTEGFVHGSIPYGNEAFKEIGEKTGAYTADFSDDMAVFTPEGLKPYDAILFNSTTQLKFTDPANRQALLDFVKSGKGIIGIHAATDNFPTWPEGQELIGGKFKSHPWVSHDIEAVKVDDPTHPLSEAFGGVGFWINDEIYQIVGPYDRAQVRVLLSLDMSKPQNQRDPTKIVRTDNDFPISWIKTIDGGGRVYYCSLGHNPSIFWTPQVLQYYLDGIQFALGDLKAIALPSAQENPMPAAALAPVEPTPLNPPPVKPAAPTVVPPTAPAPAQPAPPKTTMVLPGLRGFALNIEAMLLVGATTPVSTDPLGDGVKAISTYDYGQDRSGVQAFLDYVRTQGSANYPKIEAALLPLFANSSLPTGAKDYLCRLLGMIGSDASVPALSRLINDPTVSQLAVNALFEISTPAAKSALNDSLAKVDVKLRPAVIGAIGRDQVVEAVPALVKIASGDDRLSSLAAIDTLAAIGTPDALKALLKIQVADKDSNVLDWALINAAHRAQSATPPDIEDAKAVYASLIKSGRVNAVRVAAAAGYLAVDPAGAWTAISGLLSDPDLHARLDTAKLTAQLPADGVAALLKAFPSLDPAVQIVIVNSFAQKRTADAEPILQLALSSSKPDVHLAALRGFGTANLATSAATLLPYLDKSKPEADAAALSLAQLTDPGFVQILQLQLAQAKGATKATLLTVISERKESALKEQVFAATSDPDPAVSEAAFAALESLVTGNDLAAVLKLMPLAKTGPQRKNLGNSLSHAAALATDKNAAADLINAAMTGATPDNRQILIAALASIDSDNAAAELKKLLQAPSVDDRKEVIRALSTVRNSNSDELLFESAKNGQESSEKILALRGYLDSIQVQNLNSSALLDDYKKAWPLAIRQEEKDAILAAIKNMRGEVAKKLLEQISPPPVADPSTTTTSAPASTPAPNKN